MLHSPVEFAREDPEPRFSREFKRRRVSTPSDHRTLAQTRQGSSYWFEDGDIVLEVESHRFKIHKELLKCSDVFAGMLDIPQPPDFENVDGCPLVRLADAAQDWHAALQWIYERERLLSMPHPLLFTTVAGALRISNKYEIEELRAWSIHHLRMRWPSSLEEMDLNSLPYAAEAIVLARECEVPEILPAASYALSVQKWSCLADGGRSHLTLSAADLRRLIVARERLEDIRLDIALDPFSAGLQHEYMPCETCRGPLQQRWRKMVAPNSTSAVGCWLLRELWLLIQNGDDLLDRSLCQGCLRLHGEMLWQRYLNLKASIPRIFQLV